MSIVSWANSWFKYLVDRISSNEDRFTALEAEVKTLMATVADLEAEVAKQTTVVGSAVTLLGGLSAQLKTALASNDPVAIQKVLDGIDANTKSLSDAVVANTPAATP